MRLFLATFFVLFALASAVQAYEPPFYAQTPPRVEELELLLPSQASLGETLHFELKGRSSLGLPADGRIYIYLYHENQLHHVDSFAVRPPAPGLFRFSSLESVLPKEIPVGHYEVHAGFYKEKKIAIGQLEITGKQPQKERVMINHGTFVDKNDVPHYWHINHAHTLFWDGQPWLPAGGMFIYKREWDQVEAQLKLLEQYGVKDIYLHLGVNMPYLWKDYSDDEYAHFQKTIDYLDAHDFRYGVELSACDPKGYGFPYPAGGPRIDDCTQSGVYRVKEKKVRSALFMVHEKESGKVVQSGVAKISDVPNEGESKYLEADVQVPQPGLRYRVVFAPDRMCSDGFIMYYWGGNYEKYAAKVKKDYSKIKLGPGFRFVADPLWNEMNTSHDFTPSEPEFAQGFSGWLQKRYSTLEKLNEAWKPIQGGVSSFEAAGSAVSMERYDDKIIGQSVTHIYCRSTNEFHTLLTCGSQFEYDFREFFGRSLQSYCNRIADDFKAMNDVPIVFKTFSDLDWWHINDDGVPGGHDGLGMESYGNGEPMLMFMAAHVFGMCEQFKKTSWCLVTETGEGNHQDASPARNKPLGYSSRLGTMYSNYNALISGGAKGIFQYNMIGGEANEPWSDAIACDPRQLEWLGTYRRILDNAKNLVNYKPAMYYRFPGLFNPNCMNLTSEPCNDFHNVGGWWWRSPIERSVNDLWIVPSHSLRPDSPMLLVNLEDSPASKRFADELASAIGSGKRVTVIGYRKDLGAIPFLDPFYTDQFHKDVDGIEFQVLRPPDGAEILNRDDSGNVWNFRKGNLQVNSKEVYGIRGYRPENLSVGNEKPVDPYYGVFSELLGVNLLDLGPDLEGFYFHDKGRNIAVISTASKSVELAWNLPKRVKTNAMYSNGVSAGVVENGVLKIPLEPASATMVRADRKDLKWLRGGILRDTLNARDSVIINGLDDADIVPKVAADAALAKASESSEGLPIDYRDAFQKILHKAERQIVYGRHAEAIKSLKNEQEDFFADTTPYVWIEGEDRVSSNFNYSRLGGLTRLSGGAFLGLETGCPPPANTGYFAEYEFRASQSLTYQIWLRENLLSFCSPCAYRLDNGPWIEVPNTLTPQDIELSTLYNPVEDSRMMFAWYHYGEVQLSAGKHQLAIRVDHPRPKNTILTMADDRPYSKLIDCILLTHRGFTPNGKERPRYLVEEITPPEINLIPDPSFEFDGNKDEKPDYWKPSFEKGLRWTKIDWGNFKLEGLMDVGIGMKYSYAQLRALSVEGATEERYWESQPIPVAPNAEYALSGFLRTSGVKGFSRLSGVWLSETGETIGRFETDALSGDTDWTEKSCKTKSDPGTRTVILRCAALTGPDGKAWFDDLTLSRVVVIPRD